MWIDPCLTTGHLDYQEFRRSRQRQVISDKREHDQIKKAESTISRKSASA
jgi:hypothetical protein